jgi:hypothetical protein
MFVEILLQIPILASDQSILFGVIPKYYTKNPAATTQAT